MEEGPQLQALAVRSIVSKVLTLDEAYHKLRSHKSGADPTAYLRWRQGLLRRSDSKLIHFGAGDRREEYSLWRKMLMEQRFPQDRITKRWAGWSPPSLEEGEGGLMSRLGSGHLRSHSTSTVGERSIAGLPRVASSTAVSRTSDALKSQSAPSKEEAESEAEEEKLTAGATTVVEPIEAKTTGVAVAYEFSGMHYIFDHHKKAITSIQFAHEDKDLLAVASMDGTISICSTFDNPAVLAVLKGHTRGVTDIDWALSNDYVLSSSLDGSVRVWDVKTRKAIRGVSNPSPCHACRFLPLNTNIFIYGTTKGIINAINLSTGKCVDQVNVGAPILCFEFEPTGKTLFVGDDKGFIHLLEYNFVTGKFLARGKSKIVNSGKGVTSLEYKSWFNNQKGVRTPQLIAACQDSTIKLCGVEEGVGVKVQREFAIVNKTMKVRCSFCPLISTQSGACVVSGSEDMAIYIYNVKKKGDKSLVNKLQGHSAAVLDVSWNYEESLLASGDSAGVVIVWKRVHMESKALSTQGRAG